MTFDLRARYYDPADGRFLSRDSYAYNYQNPFELNRYSYAANSPITNYDPTGQFILVGYASGHDPSLKARAMVGGFGGALFGGLSFASFYILAITNTCGSALNEWARNLSPVEVMGLYAFSVASGAAIGALSSAFPGAGSGLAVAFGLYGFKTSVEDIQDNGANLCNVGTALMSLAGMAGGLSGGRPSITLPKPGSTMTIQYGGVAALGGLQTAEVYVSEAIVAGLSGLGGLTTLLTDKRGRGGNNDGNEDQNSAENDGNSEESGSRDDEPPDDLQPPLVHDPRVVGNYSFDDLVAELQRNNVKFKESEIVKITRGVDNKVYWLEEGSPSAGLQHMRQNNRFSHLKDKFGTASEEEGISLIMESLHTKTPIQSEPRPRGKSLYLGMPNSEKDLLIGVGDNGFVVTAFPTDKLR